MKYGSFYNLEEARHHAGFFITDTIAALGITRRTYERWRKKQAAPVWAVRLIELEAGHKCRNCITRKHNIKLYE